MNTRSRLTACLVAVAVAAYFIPAAAPTPQPDGELNLSKAFSGLTALEDASLVSALCGEIADVIDWDALMGSPVLTTGNKLDTLRTRSREMFCRGESIGDRQPKMRDLVAKFLDSRLGVSGGPVTPEQRAAWVSAYREIARAANVASH